jgi:hypothetical protein
MSIKATTTLLVLSFLALNLSAGQYKGMWWASPADSEPGWGINLEHQADTIFASWYTYDVHGDAWWLTATLVDDGNGAFHGDAYETSGPPFNSIPFDGNQVTYRRVGWMAIQFADRNNGHFDYEINRVRQSRSIERYTFAEDPIMIEEVEYNDVQASATAFLVGETAFGNLSSSSDEDWFSVEINSQNSGMIEVTFDVSACISGNWNVYWYNSFMQVLSSSNISAPDKFTYTFPAYVHGTHYLRVQVTRASLYSAAPYKVTLTAAP